MPGLADMLREVGEPMLADQLDKILGAGESALKQAAGNVEGFERDCELLYRFQRIVAKGARQPTVQALGLYMQAQLTAQFTVADTAALIRALPQFAKGCTGPYAQALTHFLIDRASRQGDVQSP